MPANPNVVVSINSGAFSAPTNGLNAGAGQSVVVQLANTAGVVAWTLSVVGVDETSGSGPVISVGGIGNTQRSFTAGAAGTTTILQSTVIDGGGLQYSTTFGIFVLTSGSARVFATGERFESSSVYGWIADLNPSIRAAGTFTLWTYHTVITSDTALSRLLYQIQPVDTSEGTFTLTLPTSPSAGDRVDIEDVGATSASTGIGAVGQALTITGTSNDIQNPHTMSHSTVSYAMGEANGDAGGATLCLRYTGTFWKVIGN